MMSTWPRTSRTDLLRLVMLVLAWAHLFPARRHLALFFAEPTLGEAWKGFGAVIAIGFYLLPPSSVARTLAALYRARFRPLAWLGFALAAVHLVPASDHLPRFLGAATWADGWRGVGSALAASWFVVPLPMQAAVLTRFTQAIVGLQRGLLRAERSRHPETPV